MILTSLPDLPPRPETRANASFRRSFYARWGRENAIVSGRSTHAEYAAIPQTLSIKMASGGRERYFLPGRDVVVDDDNLLVVNEGVRYGSLLQAVRPAWTFAVFFRPGMQDEVAAQRRCGLQAALDRPDRASRGVAFSEHLRPHLGPVSARLMHMARAVHNGERDDDWLEQELTLLLDTLLVAEGEAELAVSPRPVLRAELLRRLRRAADFIESEYTQAMTLDTMAKLAHLSRYHFVREFTRLYGLPPHAYLTRKRAHAATRLLAAGRSDREQVALQCGFGSRWSLQRALVRHATAPPI